MIEKLIIDYMINNNIGIYLSDGGVIHRIYAAGEWVVVEEKSSCGYYIDNHNIELLDIVAWVYSKQIKQAGN